MVCQHTGLLLKLPMQGVTIRQLLIGSQQVLAQLPPDYLREAVSGLTVRRNVFWFYTAICGQGKSNLVWWTQTTATKETIKLSKVCYKNRINSVFANITKSNRPTKQGQLLEKSKCKVFAGYLTFKWYGDYIFSSCSFSKTTYT